MLHQTLQKMSCPTRDSNPLLRPCRTDEPLRIMGEVFGTLNGFTIDGQQLQAYAVVSDGRSYTSVAKVVPELGYDFQSLMPVSDIVGWMFAKPSVGVRNGFQMAGERCHIGEIVTAARMCWQVA